MSIDLRFIIPMEEFYCMVDDSIIGLLQQYNIGVEDVLFTAMQYHAMHIVPVEETYFRAHLDTRAVELNWTQMQGNPQNTATKNGLIYIFIETVYRVYRLYFNLMAGLFKIHGIEVTHENPKEALQYKRIKVLDPITIELHLIFTPPNQYITRI